MVLNWGIDGVGWRGSIEGVVGCVYCVSVVDKYDQIRYSLHQMFPFPVHGNISYMSVS